jgi:FixJ family two-component response regulator
MEIKPNPALCTEPTVHVVDDDAGMRDSLDNLFRSIGYQTLAYTSVADFLRAGRLDAPGCLVLDIRLPGTSGLDFQDQLREHGATMPIILMTGHGDIPMTVRGMKGGAIDFLPKPFREQDMLDAVANALGRDAETRANSVLGNALRERYATLSPREREVMDQVVAGAMNKQIAFALSIKEITVKIHRGNAMRKMGARNLPSLVQMAEALRKGNQTP